MMGCFYGYDASERGDFVVEGEAIMLAQLLTIGTISEE